jgi:hypothetical protein
MPYEIDLDQIGAGDAAVGAAELRDSFRHSRRKLSDKPAKKSGGGGCCGGGEEEDVYEPRKV